MIMIPYTQAFEIKNVNLGRVDNEYNISKLSI
jgi:hypothetical protein